MAQTVTTNTLGVVNAMPVATRWFRLFRNPRLTPISELCDKVLASDPNAGAHSVGAQSLGAQRASNRFRI